MSALARRVGLAGFAFFFLKGLVWIALAVITGQMI